MLNTLAKDVLDHLCAVDPNWAAALQILQVARQNATDDALAATRIVCALVLLANEGPDPQAFLAHCADGLLKTPLAKQAT